jgi:prepilin signal peptidase PulO-like enzyme (type II secretory pathway)
MSEIINYIFFFSLGAVFASFLNLCVYRIEKEVQLKEIFLGKSLCDNCNRNLSWYELIPIFSFIFLKGKCSSCKMKISNFYFFSEILLGMSFLLLYFISSPVLFFVLLSILYFWAVSDFHYQSIPKNITDLVLVVSFVIWLLFLIYDFDFFRIYPLLLSAGMALIIYIISLKKKIFGLGDIIIFFTLSFWFELSLFVSVLLYSIIIGGLFGLILSLKDRKFLKGYIPFLPFVFFGFLIAITLESQNIFLFDYILPLW